MDDMYWRVIDLFNYLEHTVYSWVLRWQHRISSTFCYYWKEYTVATIIALGLITFAIYIWFWVNKTDKKLDKEEDEMSFL